MKKYLPLVAPVILSLMGFSTHAATSAGSKNSVNAGYECSTGINAMIGLGTKFLILTNNDMTKVIVSTEQEQFTIEDARSHDNDMPVVTLSAHEIKIEANLYRSEDAALTSKSVLIIHTKTNILTLTSADGAAPASQLKCKKVF